MVRDEGGNDGWQRADCATSTQPQGRHEPRTGWSLRSPPPIHHLPPGVHIFPRRLKYSASEPPRHFPATGHRGGSAIRHDWEPEDLVAPWTLVEDDWRLVATKTGPTRLGFALPALVHRAGGPLRRLRRRSGAASSRLRRRSSEGGREPLRRVPVVGPHDRVPPGPDPRRAGRLPIRLWRRTRDRSPRTSGRLSGWRRRYRPSGEADHPTGFGTLWARVSSLTAQPEDLAPSASR